ncbi:hypothetical protein HAL013_07440 [Helicobacter ailurogastricus]|uniref:Uncharacterized protein n=1 Tax=Helicobacter ailurogastricus TaxID=1578720 RepID=A0A0K2XJH4_9HELI|nr:hypothetical protein HAL013_07440 [Helicobacter ailurogastricus]CRF44869.1 hypothetical protein HAL09_14870 [Helicobacter ailurogastricus]
MPISSPKSPTKPKSQIQQTSSIKAQISLPFSLNTIFLFFPRSSLSFARTPTPEDQKTLAPARERSDRKPEGFSWGSGFFGLGSAWVLAKVGADKQKCIF